jgi:hypothetical protein
MKIKINPYLKNLIKENSLYIVINAIFLLLSIFSLMYNSSQLPEKLARINTLKGEIKELENKANIINSSSFADSQELDQDIKLLNSLIPNVEDYFSVIYALDQLSSKTSFIITSYNINVQRSSSNKLQLVITGVGDQQAFMNFLKEYNFGGGRLITADRVELASQLDTAIRLDIKFYNNNVALDKQTKLNLSSQIQEEIDTLKNKVSFLIKEDYAEDIENLNYPKKINPF